MNFLRIIVFSLISYIGYYFSVDTFQLAFSEHLPFQFDVYGVHNIAASMAGLFFGIYMVIYSLNEIKKFPFSIGEFNQVSLFLIGFGVVIGVLLNIKVHSNLDHQGYVQCSDLTKVATRFTRKTYAQTSQICDQLVKEKYGRD